MANVPDYGTEEVADSAIGLMMALTRGISRMNSLLRAGIGPWMYTQVVPLHRLRGRVFGIVGLGRIGTAAALRAKALGMDVVFYDPYKPTGYEKVAGRAARRKRRRTVRRKATFSSLHCPLTDETHHLVNRRTLAMLPAGAYLINTARGAVVDTAALPEALASGHLAGAGIDVLEHEPAAARSSVDRGVARPEPCRPSSPDYQSASGLLQRRGPDGHANQGIERLPKSPVRPADSKRH